MKDLGRCLKLISQDHEVKIVRIKNRLHPSFDSRLSGGYRDIALNLRINTEITRLLALNGHVCEVQLLLKQVAELKVCIIFVMPFEIVDLEIFRLFPLKRSFFYCARFIDIMIRLMSE